MANPKHLEILKEGVEAWNHWRRKNPEIPNLSNVDLHGANLLGVNFFGVVLNRARLRMANLSKSCFSRASLRNADLSRAELFDADFREADLFEADLFRADVAGARLADAKLSGAKLIEANLSAADLSNVDFSEANLCGAQFLGAKLRGAKFHKATIGYTSFSHTSLADVDGLDSLTHISPSSIGIDAFFASNGKIPESFFRGAGVPDIFIEYAASMAEKPVEFYSAFISYSSKDDAFAKRLHADLQSNGVRCWFAPEDLKIGDKFRPRIDDAIRLHDKLLLILSGNSVQSDWVEKEVETAFEKERKAREQGEERAVLFPVRLDKAVMDIATGWPADIRRTRHIGDFTNWKNHDSYQTAFQRLLRDLKSKK